MYPSHHCGQPKLLDTHKQTKPPFPSLFPDCLLIRPSGKPLNFEEPFLSQPNLICKKYFVFEEIKFTATNAPNRKNPTAIPQG